MTFALASSSAPFSDDSNRPPQSSGPKRRGYSLVTLVKKLNLFPNTVSKDFFYSKNPKHARFKSFDSIFHLPADRMQETTSSISASRESFPTTIRQHNTTTRERPHPPPLDTAAANNLPRHELNSSLPTSAVTPTPPPDPTNNNNHPRRRSGNNAAGPSSPVANTTFHIGVSEDVNKKCRRTMEDTHSFIYDFHPKGSDSGYFAIFDGHAGKMAAEFCGKNFHSILLKQLTSAADGVGVPEVLDRTFVEVDRALDKLSNGNNRTSGCTAVVAYTRWEDRNVPDRSAMKKAEKKNEDGESGNLPMPTKVERRRVLYTGNVGDARIILWYIVLL